MSQSSFNISTTPSTFQNVSSVRTRRGSFCFTQASPLRVFAYLAILVISLFGNSMTVNVIRRGRLARKNPHLFLLSIAIADLIITVVYMPRMVVMMLYGNKWLVTGTFGLVLCRVVPFLHHIAIFVSVLSILGATLDRFCALMFPLRNIMTPTVGRSIVVMTWLLSACLRVPYLIAPKLIPLKGDFACNNNFITLFGSDVRIYFTSLLYMYCTALVVNVLLYIVIIVKLKRAKPTGASHNIGKARKTQASRKLLHMMLAITLFFIVCWFFYFFAFNIFSRPLNCSILFLRFFLAHCNSAINPYVLIVFNARYRYGYRSFFGMLVPSCKVQQEQYLDSEKSTFRMHRLHSSYR